MTTLEPLDAPLLELTDASHARPLAPALERARRDVIAAAHDLLAIPEAALTRPWAWIGGGEAEVRYGAYRAAEALEQAEINARAAASGADADERDAARMIGPATAARWDLHGLLLPLDRRLMDADPGGGEWPLRLVLGHVVGSQRGYGWGTSWWQANGYDVADPNPPTGAPEAFWARLPEDATEGAGTVEEIRARLDAILDLSTERLAGLPNDRLGLGARWSGFAVTVGFRLGRWSSHIREHTIQVEKTLAMLDDVPNESARLVRLLLAAYGRAEAAVFGRQNGDDAVDLVRRGAAEAWAAVDSARRAAGV